MAAEPSAPVLQPAPSEEEGRSSLREHLTTLRASPGLIAAIVLVCLLGGVIQVRLATPIYRSDALIQVEKKGRTGLEDLAGMYPADNPAETEIEILRSRSLVAAVVEKLS